MPYIKLSFKKIAAFNLLEMLVVVSILSLLIGMAIPSYSNYIARSYRTIALNEMAEIIVIQEQAFSRDNEYIRDFSQVLSLQQSKCLVGELAIAQGRYCLSVLYDPHFMAYTLIARAEIKNHHADSQCYQLTLSSTGVKEALSLSNEITTQRCWY